MNVAYVDSSCMVALAFGEPSASAVLARLRQYDRLLSSTLLEAEVMSALTRERREVRSEIWAAVQLITVDRALSAELLRVFAAGYVRGADCWHLATALYVSPDPRELAFLSLDAAQRAVAESLGFRTA